MLLLLETPAGYGLFSLKHDKILEAETDAIYSSFFSTVEAAQKEVVLEAFHKFEDTQAAMEGALELVDGTLGKPLKKFLKKHVVDVGLGQSIAVLDKTLGVNINKKLGIDVVVMNDNIKEVMRGVRTHLTDLIEGINEAEVKQMALGLAHSLSRFKLKFSADKVDTMIIQAVGLLDDLDKELNNFAMRLREWYGWHFPEMGKIVTENLTYAQVVRHMGLKTKAKETDFSAVGLPDDIAGEVKQSAEISMGTEITDEDLSNIRTLCDRVIELSEYRGSLAEYLKLRMEAIAPNLTYMVGEHVGARLISHAGSLMNLAKHPSSTVQILGAEKALFRALKTKTSTPKYGLLFHASLVGQTAPALKGKISRVLAAKLSLCARVDALGDQTEPALGKEYKEYVEKRLAMLEEQGMKSFTKGISRPNIGKVERPTVTAAYNANDDAVQGQKKKARKEAEEEPVKEPEPMKKKKRCKDEEEPAEEEVTTKQRKTKRESNIKEEGEEDAVEEKPEKKKKKKVRDDE